MTPLLASYLTGFLLLLLISWSRGIDSSKDLLVALMLIAIWPITFVSVIVTLRRGYNKAKQNAGTK
jgi:hypothetical protein